MSQPSSGHGDALAPTSSRIATPAGWNRIAADGWLIHADAHVIEEIAFAEAVAAGLEQHPRVLPYRYLYDAAGSEIYERITGQPEYYPTRTEESILATHAGTIRELAGDTTLVEFGSGSSSKTRRLIEAWTTGGAARYVPIDISGAALQAACSALAAEFPGLAIEAIASTYERAMPLLPAVSPATFVFLGSSVGNFDHEELDGFLERVARHLTPGDAFLLGIDLVKDPAQLEAAYNDAAGWSARFTENLFARMNRELGTEVPLDAVAHVAYYNESLDRVEIYARFDRAVEIELAAIDRRFRIAPGEMIRTEISRKFRPDEVAANAARFGLRREGLYTDPAGHFGLLLLRRAATVPVADERAHQIEALLGRVRARTHEIVGPLSDEQLFEQPESLMGPLAWDLGHVAEFEDRWLVRGIEARERGEASSSTTGGAREAEGLDPTYDPNRHPRADREALELPTPAELHARLAATRASALVGLRSGAIDPTWALTADGFVYRMVAQHETQHQETMLQAIQMRRAPYEPPFREAPPRRPDWQPTREMVLIPGGECPVGSDDGSIAYDNERPRHLVDVPSFRIDVTPVTNGEYLEFMCDGGYERCDLWSPAGREWLSATIARAPKYWDRRDDEWKRTTFGSLQPVDPVRPVIHVSWFEADAYARWAGKRLPTEFEWEKAASWDVARGAARPYPWGEQPANARLANVGQHLLEPQPVGAYPRGRSFFGCHQMLGDVYEWTASDFLPYPGFQAFPYPEYSQVFFGDRYKVLRGASWAVPEFMARNTYRNWDLPDRRQLFAGFRCAADV